MTIAAHTLGCKLNFAETSDIIRKFTFAGWQQTDFDQPADLYVINTCTVTAIAEKKCRNAIRQAIAKNPDAIVAVIGCFAQNAYDEIARIDGVDIILGNDRKHNLLHHVDEFLRNRNTAVRKPEPKEQKYDFHLAFSHADRTRTFFKVQDGCDYFCTYCAIPFARGRSRSATVAETVDAARQIAAYGAKEVVLTGVNTGTFGQGNGETFFDLIKALDSIEGIERYRISSIEPNLLTDDIIHFVAQSRAFLPHFHIPLQAGSDKVLHLMHRRYNTEFYANLLQKIKQIMPDACIAADIMVGFNGEDDTTFEQTLQYVDSLPISYLHVFTFSERPNTAALRLEERIPVHHRREHSRQMQELSDRKKSLFYRQQQGRTRPVLWESDIKNGMMYGFTDNYIRVRRSAEQAASLVNTITPFRLDNLIESEEVFEQA
ncbi:MAG: tRNA (N(6)-L-threonylcarbamoyladenosine(37)-C(2))-methylthiotransferase MtaB [Bacteroidales bacterium]|nr:tRNA (N(6)-L-threonylcarbamoyladenosine(37)-C(2))-methylthiotransferase MtaB [Bacteroidales bacterium]